MLSNPQAKTLKTIIAKGGEVNFFGGVKGLDARAEGALLKAGLISLIGGCGNFDEAVTCEHGPTSDGSNKCYRRVRITEAGRAAVQASS